MISNSFKLSLFKKRNWNEKLQMTNYPLGLVYVRKLKGSSVSVSIFEEMTFISKNR